MGVYQAVHEAVCPILAFACFYQPISSSASHMLKLSGTQGKQLTYLSAICFLEQMFRTCMQQQHAHAHTVRKRATVHVASNCKLNLPTHQ